MFNKVGVLTLTFIMFGISLLPMAVIRVLGIGLGTILYYLARERRNVGIKNLTLCFPELSARQKHKIIKQHCQYLVTSTLEYALVFYASKKRIQKIVTIKNIEYLQEYYGTKPIILLCPHFVGLDIAAIRFSTEFVGCSIYSQQKSSLINEKLKQARLRFIKDSGGKVFARTDGLRQVIRWMKDHRQLFYYLPDQDFGERDSVFIPFFAHSDCATVSILPKLVRLMDAVVIPTAIYRVGNHYELEIFKAWQNYPGGKLEADIIKMNKFIESAIVRSIPQYFWLHKRFKTQPGSIRGSLYKDC